MHVLCYVPPLTQGLSRQKRICSHVSAEGLNAAPCRAAGVDFVLSLQHLPLENERSWSIEQLHLIQALRKALAKEGWGTQMFQNTVLFNPSVVCLRVYD